MAFEAVAIMQCSYEVVGVGVGEVATRGQCLFVDVVRGCCVLCT